MKEKEKETYDMYVVYLATHHTLPIMLRSTLLQHLFISLFPTLHSHYRIPQPVALSEGRDLTKYYVADGFQVTERLKHQAKR